MTKPAAPTEAEVLVEIRRLVMQEVGHPGPVEPAHHLLRDLALDSVAVLTLVVGLEDRYRVALAEEDAAAVHTVAELAALVARRAGEPR